MGEFWEFPVIIRLLKAEHEAYDEAKGGRIRDQCQEIPGKSNWIVTLCDVQGRNEGNRGMCGEGEW